MVRKELVTFSGEERVSCALADSALYNTLTLIEKLMIEMQWFVQIPKNTVL